eukprot:m.78847 g.78847  ORF g.78847 m.78847 type:complete len:274 (+) comp14764_c0_seq1:252-1073(+)
MADSREDEPLLPEGQPADDPNAPEQSAILDVPAESPPDYELPKWSNPQPVGSSALADVIAPGPQEAPPAFESLSIETSFGLRRVHLTRSRNGFGITVGGSAPVRIVEVDPDSEAARKGLKANDRIMEVNSEDVTYSSITRVSSLISASQEIDLAVLTGLPETTNTVQPGPDPNDLNDLWTQAFQSLDVGNIDPTQQPPSNLGPAVISMFFCPIIGCAAVWHASQVQDAFRTNNILRARGHSYMAKRLASNAVFYGIVGLVLYLFVRLNDHMHT